MNRNGGPYGLSSQQYLSRMELARRIVSLDSCNETCRKEGSMTKMMSACGVLCSDCPAYHGEARGVEHQKITEAAWWKIYGLNEKVENIRCGGCLGPDEDLFHTSRACKGRLCCQSKGYGSCAECRVESCRDLEKAQSVWDEVPALARSLTRSEFVTYALPYCGHRRRLAAARRAFGRRKVGEV